MKQNKSGSDKSNGKFKSYSSLMTIYYTQAAWTIMISYVYHLCDLYSLMWVLDHVPKKS